MNTMGNSGRQVSPQLKATILRMVRELLSKTDKGKHPITAFGLSPLEAEAAVLHVLDELSGEQIEAVLKATLALAGELAGNPLKHKELMEGNKLAEWIKGWMTTNYPKIEITFAMVTLTITVLLAAVATSESPQALIDILGPDTFAKVKLAQAQEAEKAN